MKRTVDYAAEGRLQKMSAEKAWTTIEELARYEDEGWNEPLFLEKESLDYKNPNIKQLLVVMECKVDMLMKNAISLMGRSEDVYRISSKMMHQLPPEPSRQEAFKDLVMNFILDQEEKVRQFEEYMSVIGRDFMQLSLEVIVKLREEIRVEENRVKKIEKITRYPDTVHLEPLSDCKSSETLTKKASSDAPKFMPTMSKRPRNTRGQPSSSREVSLEEKFRRFGIFDNGVQQMHHDTLATRPIHPRNANLFQINERVYRELVHEFFASIEFESTASSWRIGLYSEDQSREDSTLSKLRRAETVKANHLLMEFWPSIGDGNFAMGEMSVSAIRDPRVKLAHHCIATTISGKKDSTQRITKIDLFYLYCIYAPRVVCNIPYWLLTSEMMDALSVEPRPYIFKKKSLIAMGIVMELHVGACYWPATREVRGDDEAEEAAEEETGWSANAYRDTSKGDWQAHQGLRMNQMYN
ncbi:hypothetical protein Tco_1531387 [Tanacetum coccineum]